MNNKIRRIFACNRLLKNEMNNKIHTIFRTIIFLPFCLSIFETTETFYKNLNSL